MGEEALRLLIQLALNAFANQAYKQMMDENLHVGGDTDVTYSIYVVGTGYYTYYLDTSTSTTETCTFTISEGSFSEGSYFMNGEHVKWFVSGETTSDNYLEDINVIIATGDNYYLGVKSTSPGILFSAIVNGGGVTPSQTEVRFLSGNVPTYYFNQSYSIGQYKNLCSISSITATSSSTVHTQFPEAVYVPAPVGDVITYNEYRQQAITWANTTYNFNLTVNEFPEFEDLIDATEPEVQPVSIDYDEILGEDELESILTQETYEVSEIESITESIIIDIEDLVIEDDTEYQQITQCVPDMLAVGMDIFNELNVAAPLTSVAVIACIWKIIRGH